MVEEPIQVENWWFADGKLLYNYTGQEKSWFKYDGDAGEVISLNEGGIVYAHKPGDYDPKAYRVGVLAPLREGEDPEKMHADMFRIMQEQLYRQNFDVKGANLGRCNVTACQGPDAIFWNPAMRKFYCVTCSNGIDYWMRRDTNGKMNMVRHLPLMSATLDKTGYLFPEKKAKTKQPTAKKHWWRDRQRSKSSRIS
jgi:hypothetical protein